MHQSNKDDLHQQINEIKNQVENHSKLDTGNVTEGKFREKCMHKISTDRQEQWQRRNAIRTCNLKERQNEDTYGIMREVLGDIGVQVGINNISCRGTGCRECDIIVYFRGVYSS